MSSAPGVDDSWYWGTPTRIEHLPWEDPPIGFGADPQAAWWLVGRWLGDGRLSFGGRGASVIITCGAHEAGGLADTLAKIDAPWRQHPSRTAIDVSLHNHTLRDWLHRCFGHGATGTSLPAWALAMPRERRAALLGGYVSADGHTSARRVRVATVSKRLALGVRLLAEGLGHRAGLYHERQQCSTIQGRSVAAHPLWTVAWEATATAREAIEEDGMVWSRIRDVSEPHGEPETVYNLEVEEDHSYVAEGTIAKNCTDHSLAKGARRKSQGQFNLWGDDGLDPVEERTRVTMHDPLRYLDCHDPDGGVIENVVEASIYWRLWNSWLQGFRDLGYETQVVYLNSMFAHPPVRRDGTYSLAAPQSRDRVYVVFKKKGLGKPLNIRIMPWAWCAACGSNVQSIQSWKPNNKHGRKGRYGKQYVYRCPGCARVVTPYYWCAANAIDWTKRGERIGDRKKPLAPKTVERIRYGLAKFAGHNPFLAGAYHCIPQWVRTMDGPFGTITSQDHHQLVQPEPFVIRSRMRAGRVTAPRACPTRSRRRRRGRKRAC